MTSNWKTVRNTLVWLIVAVITMGIIISSPYIMKSSAASLPTVKSCKGLTVKQSGKDWVTVNAKGAQVNYTGVASNNLGWWRVENGKVNFKATGIYQNDYGWWRVETGEVNFKATGVYQNDFGWWRVETGKVNFNANGIYRNSFGWWKTTDGKVTFKENGVFLHDNHWYKVTDSKVDFSFTGIASNQFGSWYLEDGKVRFDKNGSVKYDGKYYIIENGKATPTDQKDRREEAVEVVKETLKEYPMSRAAMIDLLTDKEVLEDEVFTKEEATYGVDHAGVNWDDQAFLAATLYLLEEDAETPTGLSRALLKEILEEDLYTDSNINSCLSKIDKDYPEDSNFWKQSALISAQIIADEDKEDPDVSFTRDDIKNALIDYLLFTEAQAAYGAQNVKL